LKIQCHSQEDGTFKSDRTTIGAVGGSARPHRARPAQPDSRRLLRTIGLFLLSRWVYVFLLTLLALASFDSYDGSAEALRAPEQRLLMSP
jgi:hypothetical protein